MTFTNPSAFLLLIILPFVVWIGWPRLAYRRGRDAASLVIRLVLLVALILALGGPQIQQTADRLVTVFLLDVSDSVPGPLKGLAQGYIKDAAAAMQEGDQVAVVVFGSDVAVELPVRDELKLAELSNRPDGFYRSTDLASALRLGLALFPADTAKRIVVLSDGKQIEGDAEEVARLAAATDVQIDYVPLVPESTASQAEPEILVTGVDVPSVGKVGQKVSPLVTIASNLPNATVRLSVAASGTVFFDEVITLQRGEHTYELWADDSQQAVVSATLPDIPFVEFRAVLESVSADTIYQNNELSAFTEVRSLDLNILLVRTDPRESAPLREALQALDADRDGDGEPDAQVIVTEADPRDLPIGPEAFNQYDAVVLTNVSAVDLTPDRMAYLQAYVRERGGGLVVIGGPPNPDSERAQYGTGGSYGVGGYFNTPLEEALPVEMRIRNKERLPRLTMLFVLDRSGSMEIKGPSGFSNLELAKEAVVRSIDLLNDTDRTGVLSFDMSSSFVLPVQDVGDESNRVLIREMVGSLRPGGGTDIREAVGNAERVLRDDTSQIKHIILLTDGGANQEGIREAVGRIRTNYRITTSVVAVGQEYAEWLQSVADAGGGQFHPVFDVSTIPAIFTSEIVLATRAYLIERSFVPDVLDPSHPILQGLRGTLPPLDGYVASTPKETATVLLEGPPLETGPERDPILAAWQYGLGRSVAFTSGASSRWADSWLDWESYVDFWSEVVRWTIIDDNTRNFQASVVARGESVSLVVDARDEAGSYLNGAQPWLQAVVIDSELNATALRLQQTAPGRYEAVFQPQREGAYFFTVGIDQPGRDPQKTSAGWVQRYSPEYFVDVTGSEQDGTALLLRVADTTGGRALPYDEPADAFLHNLNQEKAALPVWEFFLLAAVILLPLDVAVRRLVVTRRDLALLRDRLTGRQPAYQTGTSGRMSQLMSAKDRVRESRQAPGPVEEPAPRREPRREPLAPRRPAPKASPPPPHAVRTEPRQAPERREGTLASRLLERRRSSQDHDEDA